MRRQETFEKIEKWNSLRLLAQIRGDKRAERYAATNLNRYLRKLTLPEVVIKKEAV